MRIVLLTLIATLFTGSTMQEIGDIQHLLGFAFNNQLNTMMSSCCVVREFRCPARRRLKSSQNTTNDITSGLELFSQCVCNTNRRCVLSFPVSYLPNGADGVTFDVTFVTVTNTAQYTCTYRGIRTLVCQRRQAMRTGMLGWLMPSYAGGGMGTLGVLGSSGLLGEEMEEAMEQMMESGIPVPQPRRRTCRRCAPLECAVSVSREAIRLMLYRRHSKSGDRRLYHQCLRRNSIRPPRLPIPATTTTTTTTTPPLHHTTPPTKRDSTPPPKPVTTTITTTRKTTTTTTTQRTTSTTTRKPTTKKATPTPAVIVTTPKPNVSVAPTTTTTKRQTTKSVSTASPATSAAEVISTVSLQTSTATPTTTTTTPQEITRILVGETFESTSTAPKEKAVRGVSGTGGGSTAMGGAGVVGVVIGVVAAAVVITAGLCLLFLTRRRRRKRREEQIGGLTSAAAGGKHATGQGGKGGKHLTARPLPSVSSKKAVIDAEDADEDFDKADDDGDSDDSANDKNVSEKRYTTPPTARSAARKPASTSHKSPGPGDDESLYDYLDDTAITTCPPAVSVVNVAAAADGTGSPAATSDAANKVSKESSKYYNTDGLVSSGNTGSKSVNGSANYYNLKSGASSPVSRSVEANRSASYVNAAASSNNDYERPRLHGQQDHSYTSLKTGGGGRSGETPSTGNTTLNDDHYYLQPSVMPNEPHTVYSEPYGSVKRRSNNLVNNGQEITKNVAKTVSGSNSAMQSPERKSKSASSAIPRDSERNSTESKTSALTAAVRKDSERSFRGESRTPVSRQGSNPSARRTTTPKVDHDGYLVPVTPRRGQRL